MWNFCLNYVICVFAAGIRKIELRYSHYNSRSCAARRSPIGLWCHPGNGWSEWYIWLLTVLEKK